MRRRHLFFVLLLLLVFPVVYFYLSKTHHEQLALGSGGSVTIPNQSDTPANQEAEWESGTLVNIDSTSSPGIIGIGNKSSGNVIVKDAGDSTYDGTYTENGSYQGNPTYTNGNRWLFWLSGGSNPWALDTAVPGTMGDYGYVSNGNLPGNPWNVGLYSTAPAPTVYLIATHTSAATQLDGTADIQNWTTFVPNGTIPSNTAIDFRFRTSTDATNWTTWSASTPYAASIDLTSVLGSDDTNQYLQVETTLSNTDGTSTPTLSAYTANYDTNPPPTPTPSPSSSATPTPSPSTSTSPTPSTTPTPSSSCDLETVAKITLTPNFSSIATDASTTLTAKAYDAAGNLLSNVDFTWQKSAGTLNISGDHNQIASYVAPAAVGANWIKVSACNQSQTLNFTVSPASIPTSISISATPDEQVVAPGATIQYSAKVVDQAGNDITGACPVTWSLLNSAAGSINSSGLLVTPAIIGVWPDSVKAEANCFGLTDFQLLSFATSNDARRLTYLWANPWSANVQAPITQATYTAQAYDQFNFKLPATYSFSLLDDRIGTINQSGQAATVSAAKNYGCYPNKIKITATYGSESMSIFDSIAIYPENYALLNSCNQNLNSGGEILSALTGGEKAFAASGQVFTSVSYQVEKYFRPGATTTFIAVARDQLYTPMDGVTTTFTLLDPRAGELSKTGQFIATNTLGSYPKAIEISSRSSDGKIISNTFDIVVTNDQRRATTIKVWGPISAGLISSQNPLQTWPGGNYSFFSLLYDQFGDPISGQFYAQTSDSSGQNLFSTLGPTTIGIGSKSGSFQNAIKIVYNISAINQTIGNSFDQILGPSPILYLPINIAAGNDNPASCISGKKPICNPLDNNCTGGGNGNTGGIAGVISGITSGIAGNILGASALILATILALIALLLSGLSNLLTVLWPNELWSFFFKGKNQKHTPGVAYDSVSGLPLPAVLVLLFRSRDKKLIASDRSDRNGRFALSIPSGEEYFIEVKKPGFHLLSGDNTFNRESLAYDNNYFGGDFRPKADEPLFAKSLPLLANDKAQAYGRRAREVENLAKILRLLNWPILIFGFGFSLYVWQQAKSDFNLAMIVIYLLVFVYLLLRYFGKSRSFGQVINAASGLGVDLAVVRAISETSGRLIATGVSDKRGRYLLTLPKGYYKIIATKAGLRQKTSIVLRAKELRPAGIKIWMGEAERYSPDEAEKNPMTQFPNQNRRHYLDSNEIIENFNRKQNRFGTFDLANIGINHLIKSHNNAIDFSDQRIKVPVENDIKIDNAGNNPNWKISNTKTLL